MRRTQRLRHELREGIRKRMRLEMSGGESDDVGGRIRSRITKYVREMAGEMSKGKRLVGFEGLHVEKTREGYRVRFRIPIVEE